MGGLGGADYAISHLDGNARREVLALPPDDIATAELVCTVVCREFGDQRSAAALREAVYGRHQQAQESVRDYGHALQRLHERLVAKHGQLEALPAAQLRDRLIEGLLPGLLRRHLRRRATKDAAMTFRAARDEALPFERDKANDAPAVARVCEQREQTAADLDDRVAALTDAVAKLVELTQTLQRQLQQQLPQEIAYRRRPNWREERAPRYREQRERPLLDRRRTAGPNDTCWRCHHRGHFAAQCPGRGDHYRSYPGELQDACKYRHPNARHGNAPHPGAVSTGGCRPQYGGPDTRDFYHGDAPYYGGYMRSRDKRWRGEKHASTCSKVVDGNATDADSQGSRSESGELDAGSSIRQVAPLQGSARRARKSPRPRRRRRRWDDDTLAVIGHPRCRPPRTSLPMKRRRSTTPPPSEERPPVHASDETGEERHPVPPPRLRRSARLRGAPATGVT